MSCNYLLRLGKAHFSYAPSSWEACITPTQAQTLFEHANKPKPEGCGVFACVYPHPDPSKIVKITRDPSDVAALIRTQKTSIGPKVFQAHKLGSHAYWTKPKSRTEKYHVWPDQPQGFALVLERLRPLAGEEKRTWDKRLAKFTQARQDALKTAVDVDPVTAPLHKKTVKRDVAERVCPREGPDAEICQARIRELETMIDTLADWGVDWVDIHAGNIGVDSKGRWRVLDMGASQTPLYEKDVPVLEGQRRKRRRKR